MAWQPSVFTPLLVFSALVASAIAVAADRRQDATGSTAFTVLMAGIAAWALGDAIQYGLTTLPEVKFWATPAVVGPLVAPTAALVFVLQYAGFDRWVDRRSIALLALEPAVTLVLIATNHLHNFVWTYTGDLSTDPVTTAFVYWEPWFVFHLMYTYAVMAMALGLLVLFFLRSQGVYRRQTALMLLGSAIPLAVNLLWLLDASPVPGMDLSSVAFTFTGVFFGLGFYYYDLLDLAPVARHTTVEGLVDGVLTIDSAGRITDANPVAHRILGDDDPLLGEQASSVVPQYDAVIEGESTEDVTVDVDTSQRYFDVRVSRLSDADGDDSGHVLLLRDVTERRQVEKRYQLLTENASDLIHVIQADGTISYVSPSVEGVLGFSPEELDGENALDYIHPDDRETVTEKLAELAADPDGELHAEFRVRTGDGSYRVVDSRGRNLLSDPVVSGVVVNSRDVTRRRRRERALKRQNEQLEEFASVISHDLRNPLAVARGYTDVLSKEYDDHRLPKVQDAHRRMDELLEDLLALAREGRTVDEPEPVELAAVAEAAWETVETEDATLELVDDRTLLADGFRLRQLFENLYRNACEHAGATVTVAVGALEDGFYVADDGPGIPEGDREHVFEAGVTEHEDGTGFGLAIVKRIADAHGWRVRITDSQPLPGSESEVAHVADATGGTEADASGGARFEFSEVDTPS